MALTKVRSSIIEGAQSNILDWIPSAYHAAIKDFTSTIAVHSYIQDAIDSGVGSLYFPMGKYLFQAPVYLRAGQAPNLTFVGENRTSTYFEVDNTFTPTAFNNPDTSSPVYSMFVNQLNNGKTSWKNVRFQGPLTGGHAIYAREDGSNSQALFSGAIQNCWFSLSSINGGYFYGAMNNYLVENNVFEQAKNCFRLVGTGNGDIHFANNSLYACFDSFISAAEDTAVKNLIIVDGLNAYSHYRGFLFSCKNCENVTISNVNLEGDNTWSPTELGIADFYDSTNITISNFTADNYLLDVFQFNGVEMKISNGLINACRNGFSVYGAYTSTDLFIENVNVIGATSSVFYDNSSTQGGNIYVDNCNWRNAGGSFWVDGGSCTYNVRLTNSNFINAGYPNTSSGTRNLAFNTSGDVLVQNCKIGRSTTDALANFYVRQDGSGNCTLMNCTFTDLAAPGSPEISTSTDPVKIVGSLRNRYSQHYGSAAPTAGDWKIGDRVINSAPSVGNPKGWVCTVSGTPGTWVSEGNL